MAIVSLTSLLVLTAKWCSSGECDNHDAQAERVIHVAHLFSLCCFQVQRCSNYQCYGFIQPR